MKLKIVKNWRTGWRWFSVWGFALIVFFATTPLPPEVVALLPKPLADNLVAFVAVCGLILRFVKQSDVANINYRFDGKDQSNQTANQAQNQNTQGASHD